MEKILTADEFLKKNIDYFLVNDLKQDVVEAMINFAKMHVEAALKSASEKATIKSEMIFNLACGDNPEYRDVVNQRSILKAYPLTNIE